MPDVFASAEMDSGELPSIRGMYVTKAAGKVPDDQCLYLRNYVPLGRRELRKVPSWTQINTVASGNIIREYNCQIGATSYLMVFTTTGNLYAINLTTAAVTSVGTGFSDAVNEMDIRQWKQERVLIIDETKGYCDWNGTTLTVIDAAKTGNLIEVFEGSVWLRTGGTRTIIFSAPDSYTDFSTASGGGTFILNKPSLKGNIRKIIAAPDILYVFGDEAAYPITSVYTNPDTGRTVFDVGDLQLNIGCTYPDSVRVIGNVVFTRDKNGVWQISGYSPKKISDPDVDEVLDVTDDTKPCVGVITTIYNVPVYGLLISLPNPYSAIAETWILCWYQESWFVVNYDLALTFIENNSTTETRPTCFAAYGNAAIQIFDIDGANNVKTEIIAKRYDFGEPVRDKLMMRFGMWVSTLLTTMFTITVQGDKKDYQFTLSYVSEGRVVTWLNDAGGTVTWTNDAGGTVTWLGAEFLSGGNLGLYQKRGIQGRGKRIGFHITEQSPHTHSINAMEVGFKRRQTWV